MIAAVDGVIVWFQQCGVIMRASWFGAASDAAVQSTTMFAMITNKSIDINHAGSIRSCQSEKRLRNKCGIGCRVPDRKAFNLKSCEMVEGREKVRVTVFWFGNDESWHDNIFLVTEVRAIVTNNPYTDPAIGLLIAV
jgi:hypothetical protein